MQRTLVEIVLSLAYFLDSGDDTVIDPDASVEMLEYIAANLQQLDPEERREFMVLVEEITAEAANGGENPEALTFMREFGESFGLVEE